MLQIGAYSEKNYNDVLRLLQANIPAAFAEEELRDFELYLLQEREDYFVVAEDNQVVGCGGINYFPEKKLARLSWDMIHPDYQGKGIGRKLTVHRLEHIRMQGLQEVQVRTSQMASAFYASLGFEAVETVKDYWAEGFDLVDMRLWLEEYS